MVKKRQFIGKYKRFIMGFELVNDMMLTRLLVAKAESGDYSLDDKQFYDKLRAVAIEENNNYARPFAAATAINKRMRHSKQFKALKLLEAYRLITEKYEKIGQS
jgi:hypothetical protein